MNVRMFFFFCDSSQFLGRGIRNSSVKFQRVTRQTKQEISVIECRMAGERLGVRFRFRFR